MPQFIQLGNNFFNVNHIIRVGRTRSKTDITPDLGKLFIVTSAIEGDENSSYSETIMYDIDSPEAVAILAWLKDNSTVVHP